MSSGEFDTVQPSHYLVLVEGGKELECETTFLSPIIPFSILSHRLTPYSLYAAVSVGLEVLCIF